MVKHIVMWKMSEQTDVALKNEQMNKMKALLEGLKGEVAEIVDIEVGINECDSPQAMDIILDSSFADMESLARYQVHPKHKEVGQYIKAVTCERKVVDY